MAGAKLGDKVKFTFVIMDDTGNVVDETKENDPEEVVVGEGDTIPGIEVSLVGMASGESKTVKLDPLKHFGPRFEDLVIEVEKELFPEDAELKEGEALEYGYEDGSSDLFVISSVNEDTVTLDGNHPLAGKDLTVEISVLAIET